MTSSTIEYHRNTSVIGNTLWVSNFDVGSYGIWVRASNAAGDIVGWSPQAIIDVNYAPAGISVIATGLTSTPSLTWSPVGGAALYDVWSSAFDFEVGRAPRITLPTGNGQPVRPTITWTSVSGAARYEIWLANLTTGIREISDANLLSTSYTPTTDLTNSHNYRVWIKAFDSSGAASLWSLPVTSTIASNSVNSRNTGEPPSLISDPVLEHLFASADTWLHHHVREVPIAAVSSGPDPVESKGTS